jgi:hypothetical protein
MHHQTRRFRYTNPTALAGKFLYIGVALVMFGCSNIWNAGDLAAWVTDQAVEQGCQRETIELEEWYTETTEGNVWRGTCRDTRDNTKTFGIHVDRVWKSSARAD